ncbi:sulfatase [Pectobacterium brasiliense]|uniref:sulfatase n=1 Tax=Pectobacterium brasiliense TaxID=180957 RepID=UPI0030CA819D
MKAVMLMFDTLTRNHLSPYGGGAITPNFARLAQESVQFDNFYVGSMPCMPARRELHTGRYNFLHRSWGPLEPFDFSMPQALDKHGIHTHMVTDHKHYWRDGGATYHTRYSTFEFIRGQEGDCWQGKVAKPAIHYQGMEDENTRQRRTKRITQDFINRAAMPTQKEHYTERTIQAGLDFINSNKDDDNWFLQIECFDPHEPFFVPEKYLDMYGCKAEDFNGWTPYYCATESPEHAEKVKTFYQALVTMCDDYLGKVMDNLKANGLWDDTLFIVCTDHGFLLGEHQWWGKNIMPVYNEIANTPFFIRDPRSGIQGERRQALAQTIDIPATLLDYFNVPLPPTMHGRPLRPAIENDTPIRDSALYGYFGGHVNITDGEYVYMRGPRQNDKTDLFEYTLMPTRIDSPFALGDFRHMTLHPGFDFTQGAQVMKIPATFGYLNAYRYGDKLFNVADDPRQKEALQDPQRAMAYAQKISALFRENDAPPELYSRFSLDALSADREQQDRARYEHYPELAGLDVSCEHRGVYEALRLLINAGKAANLSLTAMLQSIPQTSMLRESDIFLMIAAAFSPAAQPELVYQARLLLRID